MLGYAGAVALVLTLITVIYHYKKDGESITFTKNLMGTVVQITLIDGNRKNYEAASEKAFTEIKRLDEIFSSYKEESDVARMTKAAGRAPVKVSPETIDVLEAAVKVSAMTDGAFDPTVGSLAQLWGPSGEKNIVPDKKDIQRLLPLVDYKLITVDRDNRLAGLKKAGMSINLGGIAKGYIVKKAADVLKREGVTRGIVHAGGDMAVFEKPGSKAFVIGIQHPREKKLLAEVYLENGGVSTSGDYERFFIVNGVRYNHILDPKTGMPATGSTSVTIVHEDPSISDGLSTGVFVMGSAKGLALVDGMNNTGALIVDEGGNVKTSKGFKGKIY